MSQNLNGAVAVIGIDIGKKSLVVLDNRGAIVLRQKWSRGRSKRGWPICRRA
jgi:transposase